MGGVWECSEGEGGESGGCELAARDKVEFDSIAVEGLGQRVPEEWTSASVRNVRRCQCTSVVGVRAEPGILGFLSKFRTLIGDKVGFRGIRGWLLRWAV